MLESNQHIRMVGLCLERCLQSLNMSEIKQNASIGNKREKGMNYNPWCSKEVFKYFEKAHWPKIINSLKYESFFKTL